MSFAPESLDSVATDWNRRLDVAIADPTLLTPVYQPIVDLGRGVIAGYELLSRFELPGGASPAEWFVAAERLGRIAELDALVVARAIDALSSLPANTFLTVNVTPVGLASDAVGAVLERHGRLAPLILELTEQTDDVPTRSLRPRIEAARSRGAMIAVDDAGAGYGSLQRIMDLRPQFIKIDAAFVRDVHHDEAKAAAVEMFGTLANRIDAWLVVEGIEIEAELARVTRMGVPLGQGFLLGRPDPEPAKSIAMPITVEPRGAGELGELVEPVERLDAAELWAAPRAFAANPALDHLILIDDHDRPVRLLGRPAAGLRPRSYSVMTSTEETLPAELARRAMTRSLDERFAPVVHCDLNGRLAGMIRMERLVEHLAARD